MRGGGEEAGGGREGGRVGYDGRVGAAFPRHPHKLGAAASRFLTGLTGA